MYWNTIPKISIFFYYWSVCVQSSFAGNPQSRCTTTSRLRRVISLLHPTVIRAESAGTERPRTTTTRAHRSPLSTVVGPRSGAMSLPITLLLPLPRRMPLTFPNHIIPITTTSSLPCLPNTLRMGEHLQTTFPPLKSIRLIATLLQTSTATMMPHTPVTGSLLLDTQGPMYLLQNPKFGGGSKDPT